MSYENLIDLIDALTDLSSEARGVGYSAVSQAAVRLALNVALVELDGYQPRVRS